MDPKAVKKRGAFFLDRDGTINIDRVYINDPRLLELLPGAAAAIKKIRESGFLVVVVTNQSGIGRGLIEAKALPLIHQRLDELLTEESKIDLYQICIHRPDENCNCRKPQPKLVQEAVKKLDIDLEWSVFIGDKWSDVETGKNAGCELSILVRTGKGAQEEAVPGTVKADHIANDLLSAVDWALEQL